MGVSQLLKQSLGQVSLRSAQQANQDRIFASRAILRWLEITASPKPMRPPQRFSQSYFHDCFWNVVPWHLFAGVFESQISPNLFKMLRSGNQAVS